MRHYCYSASKSVTENACLQHWYCCKWGWTLKLRLFASLYFGSGRRISIWLFVVNFNFIFSIWQRFRAGRYKISHLQQYLSVMRHPIGNTLLIQNRKTNPPTHNYSTFAGTQSQHTEANLQKSCNSANAPKTPA